VEAKGSRRKSDDDFKNKYPFNLFSFISCRLKTLMKQFFKLKWFIFRGNDFRLSSYVAQVSRDAVEIGFVFRGQSERQIGRNKFFICSYSTRRVNDGRGFWRKTMMIIFLKGIGGMKGEFVGDVTLRCEGGKLEGSLS
jgi:hypothetical protein